MIIKPSKFILKEMPVTADNRVLEGKTQRLCPSQTLETLSGILNILFILKRFINLSRRKRLTMSKKELLINEIEQVPEPFLDEVLDFVHFLKTKIIKERLDTAIASESALRKDWLKPEEDEAWQNL